MSLTGLRLHDSRTGIDVCILQADEAEGRGFELEYVVPCGGPREVVMPHWHRGWTERFEVVSGRGRYRLGRAQLDLANGDAVELPPGVPHLHPWNVGETELRVRQTTSITEPDPNAVRDTILSFAMLFWLSREGRVNARGMPHLLQGALILQSLQRHGGFLPGIPVVLQCALVDALSVWARRSGYQSFDPACLAT